MRTVPGSPRLAAGLLPQAILTLSLAVLSAACGTSGNGSGTDTPTVTATATVRPTATRTLTPPATILLATATPTLPLPTSTVTSTPPTGLVSGLVVLYRDVAASSGDRLGLAPDAWMADAKNAAFDRGLAYADWTVDGDLERGVTGTDGHFEITGLEPGAHTLQVTKTLDGNLVLFTVPFTVGDDGRAEIVAEVKWGLVRATSTYTKDGVSVREVVGPSGNRVTIRDGKVAELGDLATTISDPDGDGVFSPECDDCAGQVCVSPCGPVEIVALSIGGSAELIVGQPGALYAAAILSNGTQIDATNLVEWTSSDTSVLTVDSWGALTALAAGNANVTATLGNLNSEPWPITVTARPALRRILVRNINCYCGPTILGRPNADGSGFAPCLIDPPVRGDLLPVPTCHQVVRIGGTIQFSAIGEYGDGAFYEDLTGQVTWQVSPPELGDISAGLFTAVQEGTGQVVASLGEVASEPLEVRVVTQPTVVSLSIYPNNFAYDAAGGGPLPPDQSVADPCFECGYTLTVLKGDGLGFSATAQYDTGDWEDVTARVTWRTSDAAVATIDAGGRMMAVAGGSARIDATLDSITSNPVDVRVVNEATLQSLSIYQEGTGQEGTGPVIEKGGQAFFHASGYYDVGFQRDVTSTATWQSSDDNVGGFAPPGVFTGRAAGTIQVWAEIDGKESNRLTLEVYETSELDYCDADAINRAVWSDDFNRVILESDCAVYSQPGVATLRYTVTETQPHGGIFDPCLDLYVYRGDTRIRTLREEGCGDPFLARGTPEYDSAVLKYQLRAFWDLKDEDGQPVSPGPYTIYGRFYLYYDPVVSIEVSVQ